MADLNDLLSIVHLLRKTYSANMRFKLHTELCKLSGAGPYSIDEIRGNAVYIVIRSIKNKIYGAGTFKIHIHVHASHADFLIQPSDLLYDLADVAVISRFAKI